MKLSKNLFTIAIVFGCVLVAAVVVYIGVNNADAISYYN